MTIAHRKAIDQIRTAHRAPRPTDDLPDAPSWDDPPVQDDAGLRAALEALAPKQRLAVIYRYLADLPYGEVAALLDCSEAAARRNAADGIAKLRTTCLGGQQR